MDQIKTDNAELDQIETDNAEMAETWIDTHCHIHDERIPSGTEGAIDSARAAGVTAMITVGCDRPTSLAAIETAATSPMVFATVGLHPHDASNGIETIIDLVDHPDIIAIGEAGLDYYYDHSPRDVQQEVFAAQIAIAHERDLPLVIHTRDAWDDTFDILVAEGAPEQTIFHCFTGGPEQLHRALDLGAFISFSGIVTFASATEVRAAATECPLDRLLVETDSPYLAPVPHRGQRNQPAWVPYVGAAVANLKGVTSGTVARSSSDTARRAFPGLDP